MKKGTNMKRKTGSEDGFTLVEVLTVLVIIAILAAVAIPTMNGFVNDAKRKPQTTQAREVYVAAQAAATGLAQSDVNSGKDVTYTSDDTSAYIAQVKSLLGVDMDSASKFTIILKGQRVSTVEYTPADGETITISGGDTVSYD